ncbi:type I iterative polyketide synthase [Penicillium hordei]|uniref:Type I iterative polyketide synthase n=1 Tax=Penicillium hordei TaxID=40994 RepID=A0AAD6H464_9EURO|nr:type I iterative polyketide synthase [Penicillium hordei]KAJ5608144.1 type I iterative polyketide synthase [Penicillium hordei]
MPSESGPRVSPKVFLFGPQALAFDTKLFTTLHSHLYDSWALDALSELPIIWESLVKQVPKLQHVEGQRLLRELHRGLQTGSLPDSLFPLPNILLSPLVVIVQLTQYLAFVRSGLPGLGDTDEIPQSVLETSESLGLCTGILSAFAVSCASSLAKVQQYGAVAVRLSMLVGALVDAEEASPDTGSPAMSFSMSWNALESRDSVDEVLAEFPEAYISVFVDEKRATVTAPKESAPALLDKLRLSGAHVTEVALSGRFHWPKHREDAKQLIAFCDRDPKFQFPDPSEMVVPSRLSTGGRLHENALQEILLKPSEWLKLFSLVQSSHIDAGGANFVCFGPERCVPPTMIKKLGPLLIHISDSDLSTSSLPSTILRPTSALPFDNLPDDQIAVIGMACHVPGAEDLDEYWRILTSGQSQHTTVPLERFSMKTAFRELEENRKWYGNFLRDYDTFDHKFFKKSAREMSSADPQHRLVLKLAYQAIEQSGYFGASHNSKHIGCYIGIGNNDYERNIACHSANAYSATGNLRSFAAGKVSHYFGWTGPSLTIDTACSSSGVAIHQACRAILHGECTSALAGGVNVLTSPEWFQNLAGASFLSPTGQCKPFDARGDGYCRGEGAGVVFLKRLSSAIADGDQVLGVIASTKVYQNQNCTAITVPNSLSLAGLFGDVVEQARLEPQAISVVEAHGTGTPVGDPAEYDAVRRVFGGSIRSDALSLMSVKGLLGHTEFASGIVSLVKILLMINKGFIPPQASFTSMSPALNAYPEDMIDIATQLTPWNVDFRAALINNYGASGSNASMIITQAPKHRSLASNPPLLSASATSFPFWFCGSDSQSLRAYATKFRRFIHDNADSSKDLTVRNLSFQISRQSNRNLPKALIFNAASRTELEEKLLDFEQGGRTIAEIEVPPPRPVILCFGGQISTYVGLGKDVYNQATILRSHLDQCDTICLSLGLGSIYPAIFQRSPILDTVELQTVLFAAQYSCARAWIDSGVKVTAVIGHSFGELTALCIAGAYSLTDALRLISGRARLIHNKWGSDKGSMLAVEADLVEVTALLSASSKPDVSIACYNGPRSFTLAGSTESVQFIEELARSNQIFTGMKLKKLNVTNAFHSANVDPLISDLEALGREIQFSEPIIQVEAATETRSNPNRGSDFIARHLRNPVYFNHAVQRLAEEYPAAIWLEAGSNSTITTMIGRALGNSSSPHHFQGVHITSEESLPSLAKATTNLWKEGLNVSFWAHHSTEVSHYTVVMLPPYQFEKARHWMDLKEVPEVKASIDATVQPPEPPKGLTTFIGFEDQTKQSARFRVNTTCDKFQQLTLANVALNTTAVTPGMLQIEISLDAIMNLQPDFKAYQFQPEVQGVSYHNALVDSDSTDLYLDVVAKDDGGLAWRWRLYGTDSGGRVTDFSSGNIVFLPASDPALKENFERLSRLSGKKRCTSLLQGNSADDVLQGRNIYRAFEQVVNYAEPFRCVTKIVGKEDESAGYVSKEYAGETWMDPVLTECFCQVAGIFINLMTDASDLSKRGVYICDGISRWMHYPRLGSMTSPPDAWEVFAVHHQESETKYVSDVFAFDPRDGSLVEAILGISYRIVPMDSMRKLLTRGAQQESHFSTAAVSSKSTPVYDPTPTTTVSSTPSSLNFQEKAIVKNVAKPPGPDISAKMCEIVCNLSGLEPEEIEDDSDLIELGIDSLMAMELVREVDSAFKCTLQNDQLMDLTDFASLVSCIRSTLGFDDEESGVGFEGDSSVDTEAYILLEPNEPTTNINGANGIISFDHRDGNAILSMSTLLDAFREIKWDTDDDIVKGQLGTYSKHVMPRSTELCIVYIVNAFEQLGCPIRSAAPGQVLTRVPYHPKHEKFMNMIIYGLLEKDARLIDINGSTITRTAVAPPTASADTLLNKLLHDEPVHAAEHKLAALVGQKFADLIMDKEDGLKLIFGNPESREIAADMYSNSPVNTVWIKQLERFFERVLGRLPKDGQPICILEVGGGTGGTTSRIVPLLAKLGVPVKYTMTDISGSLIAAARKRFKKYPFMDFKPLNMENEPDAKFLQSQHIILATNCIHATRNLSVSLKNLHRILRPDGALIMLEMTEQVPWCDFIFGLLEGWWLFEDGRDYVLQPANYWEKVLHSVGYGHVDWTEGELPEARIQRLIIAHASGSRYDRGPKPPLASIPELTLPDISERQARIDATVHKYTKDFVAPSHIGSPTKLPSLSSGQCVLVTGATGSLGAHIVAFLAQRPDIHTVVCLNRLSTTEATVRQQNSLQMRGISLDPTLLCKLKVIETDTSKPNLGLSPENHQYLIQNVTEIVHSAWPMSLTRPMRAYEPQFKIARNLIDLACEVTLHRPAPFKFGFQFISSSAVIANYPLWAGTPLVPEQPGTVESVPLTGYAEAKLATERILAETLYCFPERFHVMAVRIAQITGSTSNGYWNPSEYMPFLIKSSQVLKILPDLDGTLSWYPVNDVAAVLGELLLSQSTSDLIYHIDNPSRQKWREMIAILARALDLEQKSIVPFTEWVNRVRGFRGSITDNPALQLIDFFEHYFVPMSCGGLVLDTTKSSQHSKTLQNQGPIDENLMMKYIARWKESGFLNP